MVKTYENLPLPYNIYDGSSVHDDREYITHKYSFDIAKNLHMNVITCEQQNDLSSRIRTMQCVFTCNEVMNIS